jgi:hypothetical protein
LVYIGNNFPLKELCQSQRMAELASAQAWLLAEFAHRANSDRSALPSGQEYVLRFAKIQKKMN